VTVRVVTDCTADLPDEIVQELSITVVPLHIHFGQETYEDGVTITKDEFYRRLTTEPTLSKTSTPAADTFTEAYERIAGEADGIISVHISSKLSATHTSAQLGREGAQAACDIVVIDTYSASIGLGLLAIAHTTAEEEMERLGARLAQYFPADRIIKSRGGATLGTYLGPNTLCLAIIQEGTEPPTQKPRRR
jgi:fatty acid-binding protein DegV